MAFAPASRAAIVYDNLATPLGSYVSIIQAVEAADDVTLGPGPRIFQKAEIAYTGINFSGNETLTLNLYEMNGAPAPGSFGFNTPGTLLFTQTVPVSAGDLIALFEDASGTVLLPDYIGIGLIFEGIGGIIGVPNTEDAGPRLFDPPDVGDGFTDYWLRGFPDSVDDWALFVLANEIPANFGARITTVPEPSALLLLALAFAGFIRCRRRKR